MIVFLLAGCVTAQVEPATTQAPANGTSVEEPETDPVTPPVPVPVEAPTREPTALQGPPNMSRSSFSALTPIPFRSIVSASTSGVPGFRVVVAANESVFEAAFREIAREADGSPLPLPIPEVNFTRERAVFVILPEIKNSCYSLAVVGAGWNASANRTLLVLDDLVPAPSAWCPYTMNTRWILAALPANDSSLEVARLDESRFAPTIPLLRESWSGVTERSTRIISNEMEWEEVWTAHATGWEQPPGNRPTVNFTTHRVVFASLGETPAGGFDLWVMGARFLEGNRSVVDLYRKGPGETPAYHVVKRWVVADAVPRLPEPPHVVHHDESLDQIRWVMEVRSNEGSWWSESDFERYGEAP
ncbi:MAG TPA: hypothetical protein VNZ52_04980 [Candidatus Thermoplasmatota archaeon]|nr:hypothetical protein [Candidatus Thermoplasmatota archaeon]